MGFAQKLGEFAEGVAGGLLPGLQVGQRIGSSRAAAQRQGAAEKRLAAAADRA